MEKTLQELRIEAANLGLTPHHKAKAETIQKQIDAHRVRLANQGINPEDLFAPIPDQPVAAVAAAAAPAVEIPVIQRKAEGPPPYEEPMSEAEYLQLVAQNEHKLIGTLVRVRIQNMHPQKKEWFGEIISTGSAKAGTFKKFIPFNTGEPYHIPRIMLSVLKEKQCSQFYTVDDGKGHKHRKSRLINEYVIEELPPLTPLELKELAMKQAMAAGKQGQ